MVLDCSSQSVALKDVCACCSQARTLRRTCLASTAVIRLNLSLWTPVGNLIGMPSLLCTHIHTDCRHIPHDVTDISG